MEKKSKIKAAVVGVFAFGVAVSLIFAMLPNNRQWTVLGTGESVPNPATGTNSGICGFYVFNAGSTYADNLTAGTGGYYSGSNANNATNLDFQHTVNQDLIVFARINNTDCGLDISYTRCNMTCAAIGIGSSDAPDQTVEIASNASFIWVNFVWEDVTCTRGQTGIQISDIILKGYK